MYSMSFPLWMKKRACCRLMASSVACLPSPYSALFYYVGKHFCILHVHVGVKEQSSLIPRCSNLEEECLVHTVVRMRLISKQLLCNTHKMTISNALGFTNTVKVYATFHSIKQLMNKQDVLTQRPSSAVLH